MSKQAISLSYLYGGKWIGFSDQTKSTMDCLKIKTSSNESFYLQYRTWNKGMNGYYPYVKSTENDYAGSQVSQFNNFRFKHTGMMVRS